MPFNKTRVHIPSFRLHLQINPDTIQKCHWPDGEVETLGSAKPRCEGSIPSQASIMQLF